MQKDKGKEAVPKLVECAMEEENAKIEVKEKVKEKKNEDIICKFKDQFLKLDVMKEEFNEKMMKMETEFTNTDKRVKQLKDEVQALIDEEFLKADSFHKVMKFVIDDISKMKEDKSSKDDLAKLGRIVFKLEDDCEKFLEVESFKVSLQDAIQSVGKELSEKMAKTISKLSRDVNSEANKNLFCLQDEIQRVEERLSEKVKQNVSRRQLDKELRELQKSLIEFLNTGHTPTTDELSGNCEKVRLRGCEQKGGAKHEYEGCSPKKKVRYGLRQFGGI